MLPQDAHTHCFLQFSLNRCLDLETMPHALQGQEATTMTFFSLFFQINYIIP